ncbi:Uroporphyrinogen-III methyltransferase [Chitinispirillum alkaliphilum]|nr:Uroporphyrinogen-III methyltransferase [Chitinispirillum alkaliphilum]
MDKKKGKVYLLGAGPGDPSLITVKAAQVLRVADVVVYDYLASPRLLEMVDRKAEKIYVGKLAGKHTVTQQKINSILIEKAKQGALVARLKGGDPFVFGRGGEECVALFEAGMDFEIVPGVTAGIASAAYAGIPVTHREKASSVAFITGHEDPNKEKSSIDYNYLARGVDTLVFYMGVGNLKSIVQKLIAHGRSADTPAAVVMWGTMPYQKVVTSTLSSIEKCVEEAALKPPAVIIIGNVVELRNKLCWFERKPLFGKTIINTRSPEQAPVMTDKLGALGADVIEFPLINISHFGRKSELEDAVKKVGEYDWLIFTSANGVRAFFKLFLEISKDIRALGNCRIACIGPATREAVEEFNLKVEVTARSALAEGLIEELKTDRSAFCGKNVLLPRALKARDILPETLRSWGAAVRVVPAYETTCGNADQSIIEKIVKDHYDLILFSSSSTFLNLFNLLRGSNHEILPHKLRGASIGPITSSTMKQYGVTPTVEAKEHTMDGLVQAIEEYYTR